jgi:hypothetical protein
MNQRTHAWIAIRAIKLLEDDGSVAELVKLLKPNAKIASIGAWIPDKRDAKLGSAATQNHVFKIGPYKGAEELRSRFIFDKSKMLKFLTADRHTSAFFERHSDVLTQDWWSKPYKSDPPPGKHLANRAMALDINNIDLLILGDTDVQNLVAGNIGFIKSVAADARTKPCQAALYFFMLSHFIADALMPCHCDERDLSDYDAGLHKQLESHWGDMVGSFFDEDKLLHCTLSDDEVLVKAKEVSSKYNIDFINNIPATQAKDIWEEVVLLCRASFAIASVIAPYTQYNYKPDDFKRARFNDIFKTNQAGEDLLKEIDQVILHDAVLNVAMVWKNIWNKFN